MNDISTPPERPRRTKFDRWLFDNGISNPAAAERLGVTAMSVRRYRAPFGATDRRIPDQKLMREIFRWTGGEVTPNDFHELPAAEAAPGGDAADPAVTASGVTVSGDRA